MGLSTDKTLSPGVMCMTRDEAMALYNTGSAAVVEALCDLSDTVEAQQKQIKSLELKIAKLSKNSSNSGKRPSSDDITKPKPKKGRKKESAKSEGSRVTKGMFAIHSPRMRSTCSIRTS